MNKSDTNANQENIFRCEPELVDWFDKNLANDFIINKEITGKHILTNKGTKIDYILYPKMHLIDQGFVKAHFGIEVKHFDIAKNDCDKIVDAFWQTFTYMESSFDLPTGPTRLKFGLIFSDLSFNDSRRTFLNTDLNRGFLLGLTHLANNANVGILEIYGKRSEFRGWRIDFAGESYFSCYLEDGKKKLTKAHYGDNIINKIRVGNCY
jgi:hypothetical protein